MRRWIGDFEFGVATAVIVAVVKDTLQTREGRKLESGFDDADEVARSVVVGVVPGWVAAVFGCWTNDVCTN